MVTLVHFSTEKKMPDAVFDRSKNFFEILTLYPPNVPDLWHGFTRGSNCTQHKSSFRVSSDFGAC
jgi:hypothetical protein